jgi:hypothetical protein
MAAGLAQGTHDATALGYRPFGLPAWKLVIDMRKGGPGASGVVKLRRAGYTPVASIEARVEELLAGSP